MRSKWRSTAVVIWMVASSEFGMGGGMMLVMLMMMRVENPERRKSMLYGVVVLFCWCLLVLGFVGTTYYLSVNASGASGGGGSRSERVYFLRRVFCLLR